ncbi:hypothetical protein M406DRAFT_328906 [Cryphonectria parasitica EP155]|uniref:Uncharacterized protein n=1 Tax=Cryphonectria parasitica (strain ATCC 38755 / EP155) TaxID=660469 RepID=A0A9P5CRT1_CRYP1|nr:uncharacterized protein M406DRAFT_328906 [Cryphonectria parasitica EP155]KAF3767852.1 hypothetical protein M406DRAFT_328906 [Cryphonectria parasitica EP155]
MTSRLSELGQAHLLHSKDLTRIQNAVDGAVPCPEDACVLVLVKFPDFVPTRGCRSTKFQTGRIRLTRDQVLGTGSELLRGMLDSETHQRRAREAAAPLPGGVTHVLDLSPTTDEHDFTMALQHLSIPDGIKLWYRSVCMGVSPLAVAGHDDACDCLLPFKEAYPFQEPPIAIQGEESQACIWDVNAWPLEEDRDIPDFCQTRWAANTIRLFRSIAQPPGRKDLLIDSAPRMWTLVGLFAKFEMTNYDILRDEITAWFNADRNYLIVELLPEETLRIGLTLKIPLLAEPAFRILVNERALEVAGGQPRAQPRQTIFGRRCSDFSGTDTSEAISRIVEYAGTAMADRYKLAVDNLLGDNALDILQVPEWQDLRILDHVIPKDDAVDGHFGPVRDAYDKLMSGIRFKFHNIVNKVMSLPSSNLGSELFSAETCEPGANTKSLLDMVDGLRAYSVPQNELNSSQHFPTIYHRLGMYQRALCPFIWKELDSISTDDFPKSDIIWDANMFIVKLNRATAAGDLPDLLDQHRARAANANRFIAQLLEHVVDGLCAYVGPLFERDEASFLYALHPHLVLTPDDHEMNFLRLVDDETRFEAPVPEADYGPNGPGPAFHTGHTLPSVSDLNFEDLSVRSTSAVGESDDGASTVVGSAVAQDGFSTVYNSRRVLARSDEPSVSSEHFTDEGMSADYADAEYAVPAAHQARGQVLAGLVEGAYQEHKDDDPMADPNELPDDFYEDLESDFFWGTDEEEEEEEEEEVVVEKEDENEDFEVVGADEDM